MEIITFKTNITTSYSVELVAPFLNNTVGKGNWTIDTASADKILTANIHKKSEECMVVNAVRSAGFSAMNLEDYYAIF